jgi:hypothetical protein
VDLLSQPLDSFFTAAQFLQPSGGSDFARWPLPFGALAEGLNDAERLRLQCEACMKQLENAQSCQQDAKSSLDKARDERDRLMIAPFAHVDLLRMRADDQLSRMNETHAAEIESIIASAELD